MPTLDLHGCRYEDVGSTVEKFVSTNEAPLLIITGHSEQMKERVRSVLHLYGLYDRPERLVNMGCMVISETPWRTR